MTDWVDRSYFMFSMVFVCLGLILMIIGASIAFNPIILPFGIAIFSSGIGVFSLGIAFDSKRTSRKSDLKMTALAELNFVEKNAMICEYIEKFGEIKNKTEWTNKQGQKTGDSPIKDIKNKIKRCIRDLEAALKVIDWTENETKEKFIKDFYKLDEIITDKSVFQYFDKDDKKDYKQVKENVNFSPVK